MCVLSSVEQLLCVCVPPCEQLEVENFKKVHLITKEEFDCLTPEPPVDPDQEVPPGPPRPQQSESGFLCVCVCVCVLCES